MDGIICIDKPSGPTSFAVVEIVRRLLKEKKAGHSGTLDPLATGVLPIFLGRATKAIAILPRDDKRYTAVVKFGVTTDTGDITGKKLSEKAVRVSPAGVAGILPRFIGEIDQVPPMYSAIKVGGRKLYELARSGIQVERKKRRVTIQDIRLLSCREELNEYTLDISCSKGTYIRSLCEDLGAQLGCGATMAALRRTLSAGYTLADCLSLEQARCSARDFLLPQLIHPVESIFIIHKEIFITDKQSVRFLNGGALSLSRLENCPAEGYVRVKTKGGQFLGIGAVDGENSELKVKCLFAGGEIFENLQDRRY